MFPFFKFLLNLFNFLIIFFPFSSLLKMDAISRNTASVAQDFHKAGGVHELKLPANHQLLFNNKLPSQWTTKEAAALLQSLSNANNLSFVYQQHQQQQLQQQQQQQNEKATVATLTQLPATTTVARKTSISLIANNVGIVNGGGSLLGTITSNNNIINATSSSSSAITTNAATTIPKETNTILLQTPINASQLETVLLQSGQLKKSNSTVTSGTERPFLFKNVSSF